MVVNDSSVNTNENGRGIILSDEIRQSTGGREEEDEEAVAVVAAANRNKNKPKSKIGNVMEKEENFSTNEKEKANETNLSNIIIRVKRKRSEIPEAPSVLVLPRKAKRSKITKEHQDELNIALEKLNFEANVENDGITRIKKTALSRKRALVCELVDEKVISSTKKQKFVRLAYGDNGVMKHMPVMQSQLEQNQDGVMDQLIWEACQYGELDRLLEYISVSETPKPNYQRTVDGVTALMAASVHGNAEATKKLLELGADPLLKDQHGRTAIAVVGKASNDNGTQAQRKFAQVVRLLKEADDSVFDTYIVQQEIPVESIQQRHGSVCERQGLKTAWQDAPVVSFELDLECMLEDEDLLADAISGCDRSSVDSEDLEDENHENYLYNDYPDEEHSEISLEEDEFCVRNTYNENMYTEYRDLHGDFSSDDYEGNSGSSDIDHVAENDAWALY